MQLTHEHEKPTDRYLCERCLTTLFDDDLPSSSKTPIVRSRCIVTPSWAPLRTFLYAYGPILRDGAEIFVQSLCAFSLSIYGFTLWLFPDLVRKRTPDEEEKQKIWRTSQQAKCEEDRLWRELARVQRWRNRENDSFQRRLLEKEEQLLITQILETKGDYENALRKYHSFRCR
jgi:hypothetical protein